MSNEIDYRVGIDWYSFTVPTTATFEEKQHLDQFTNWLSLTLESPKLMHFLTSGDFVQRNSRRPYQQGIAKDDNFFVWYGGHNHMLVEITGKFCSILSDCADNTFGDWLNRVIQKTSHRATRIDLALDIKTDVRPVEVFKRGFNPAIKSLSQLTSQTGETVYLGSKKAEKYTRIYRYDIGDRKDFLRIEQVYRRKSAKAISKNIVFFGVGYCIQQGLNSLKLKHPIIPKVENHSEKLKSEKHKSSDVKKLHWFKHNVVPALRDLLVRGVISIDEINELIDVEYNQNVLPF